MSLAHDLATRALRALDPEDAHHLALAALKVGLGPRDASRPDPALATSVAGLILPNPVGLAAGFDKNGEVVGPMLRAGFGFVEFGTVTPRPQVGNPRPRLFRLTGDKAVINRMGFNNAGLEAVAARLGRRPHPGVVGANVGANKDSVDRIADYVAGLKRLAGLADYFTLNVSSPNTPGLRALQSRGALQDLLGATASVAGGPLFLKVAPDLTAREIEDIAQAALGHRLAGVIVGNTTVERPAALRDARRHESGGLSGAPLLGPSTRALAQFRAAAGPSLPLIGVGGIASGADAYAKIRAGASAVQLYSALVFEGPGLVARIKRELSALLAAEGFASVAQAVGA
jgi:dihydroorotate dehydrogenase